jgi:hypothetical protein
MASKKSHPGHRSSVTGQFISQATFNRSNPDNVEKIRIPNPGKGTSK